MEADPSVDRAPVSLVGKPIPGDTGIRYWLTHSPRGLTFSVAGTDEVWVTHGCRHLRLTAAEAIAAGRDLIEKGEEATP